MKKIIFKILLLAFAITAAGSTEIRPTFGQIFYADEISPKYGSAFSEGYQDKISFPEPGATIRKPLRFGNNPVILEPGFPHQESWRAAPPQNWNWQVIPSGLIYPSYLAGPKESRLGTYFNHDSNHGGYWDFTLGGRAGLIRFGSKDSILPSGFQLDVEGAVIGRMDFEHERDMVANDFRFGFPLTFGNEIWQFKLAYYHVSSHMGDEYMIVNDTWKDRLNYYRESIVFGASYRPHRDFRFYAEVGCAFFRGEETEPWEFQFGAEYSPMYPSNGICGAPFLATNVYLREENNFGGSFVLQLGWQWRGAVNRLFRVGLEWFNGKSEQYEFYNKSENRIGLGVWYDF